MKRRKLIDLGLILPFVLLVAACNMFSGSTTTTTTTAVPSTSTVRENKLTSISTNIERQEVVQGHDYTHDGVIITAHYQDETTKDVTKDATFSSIDTSRVGYRECVVTYSGKSVKIIVDVVANAITKMNYNLESLKTVYTVGQRLDTSNLAVSVKYTDGTSKTVTDYEISILDSRDKAVFENGIITEEGLYKVQIAHNGFSTFYNIAAYNSQGQVKDIKVDNLISNYNLQNNTYAFTTNEAIVDNCLYSGGPHTKIVRSSNVSYQGTRYSSHLEINENSKLKLHLDSNSTVIIVASANNEQQINFNNTPSGFARLNSAPMAVANSLPAGDYTLTSNDGPISIYEIILANNSAEEQPTLTGLTLDTSNVRLTYNVGDTFSSANLIVTANYSDNTTANVTANATLSNVDMTTPGTKTITVSYGGASRTFNITVTAASQQPTLTGLTLDTSNVRLTYNVGDTFSSANLIVTANYSDNTTRNVTANATLSTVDMTTPGIKTVTVTYGGASRTYNITVTAASQQQPTLTGLTLDTSNVQLTYNVGDTFSSANLIVTANYSDNTTQNVTANATLSTVDMTTPGTKTVTVTYGAVTQTFNITVNAVERTLTGITLDTSNVLRRYHVGDSFNSANLVVTANYSDNTTEDVTANATITSPEFTAINLYYIRVTYEGKISGFYISVVDPEQPTVTSLTVDTSNVQLIYGIGERFNNYYLRVTATYSDNTTEEVGNGVALTEPDMSTYGTKTVEVFYGGVTTSFEITVTDPEDANIRYVTFGYSGYEINETITRIVIDENLNPLDYFRVPNDDYFCAGLSHNLFDVQTGDFVKIYVDRKVENKCLIGYINQFGVRIIHDEVAPGTALDHAICDRQLAGNSNRFFIDYSVERGTIANSDMYVIAYMAGNSREPAPIYSQISSTTSASIVLNNNNEFYNVNLTVTADDNTSVGTFNQLPINLTNLDPNKQYTVSGSLIVKENEFDYWYYDVSDITFSTGAYAPIAQINSDDQIEAIAGNMLAFRTSEYVSAAPNGYALAGFELASDDGHTRIDSRYAGDEVQYINGLDPSSEYDVIVYYDPIGTAPRARRAANVDADATPGYRFRFVGFRVIGYRNGKLFRIRMMHDGDLLYTYYVESGTSCFNAFQFALPIKYENEKIIGSTTNLYNVSKDMDVEVMFKPKPQDGNHIVVFYNFYDAIEDVQEVRDGGSAQAPQFTQQIKYNNINYNFLRLNNPIDNVTEDLYVKAVYQAQSEPVVPYTTYRIYVEDTKINVIGYHYSSNYLITYKDYVVGPSGKIEYTNGTNKINDTYGGLTPDTTYKFYNEITYDLLDGNGPQNLTTEVLQFTTLSSNATINSEYEIKQDEIRKFNYSLEKKSGDSADFYGTINGKYDYYSMDDISISSYKPNTKFDIYYCKHISSDSKYSMYYMYDKHIEFTVPEYDKPDIEEIEVELLEHGIRYTIKGKNVNYIDLTFAYILPEVMVYYPELDTQYNPNEPEVINYNGFYSKLFFNEEESTTSTIVGDIMFECTYDPNTNEYVYYTAQHIMSDFNFITFEYPSETITDSDFNLIHK